MELLGFQNVKPLRSRRHFIQAVERFAEFDGLNDLNFLNGLNECRV